MGQNEKYSEMRKKPMEYRKVFDTIPEQFDEHPAWENDKLPGEFTAIAKKG